MNPAPAQKKKTRRFVAVAMMLIAVAALLVAGFLLFPRPRQIPGIPEDFKDVPLEKIIAFAERANAAYHEPRDFHREYGAQAADGEFPRSGLRIYLDTDPAAKEQWVVIRGTANLQDIVDDLEFIGRAEHELGINVHSGFDRSLQECLPWLLARLDKTRPVWVTGHSLGGSVAALLVATLDHRGFKNVSAITFGQPKFTDSHGAAKLAHLDILRIVHDEDPVPMLPPVDLEGIAFALYHHSGPEVLVGAGGHFRFLPGHASARMDVTRYWAELKNIRPMSHDMVKGYLPALKSAMASAPKLPGALTGKP